MIRYERLSRQAGELRLRLRAAGRSHAERKHGPQMNCRLIFTCTINTRSIQCWLCSIAGALRGSRAWEPFVLCNPADAACNSQNLQTVAAFKVFADPGRRKLENAGFRYGRCFFLLGENLQTLESQRQRRQAPLTL